jgi:outer membrane protein insertion porin family
MKVSRFHTGFGSSIKVNFVKKFSYTAITLFFVCFPSLIHASNLKFDNKIVNEVHFNGNEFFSDRQLNAIISTRSSGILRKRHLFNSRVLTRDLNEIQRNYYAEGFLECEIMDSVIVNEKERVLVFIRINEGPRFYVDRVSVSGNTLITDKRILSLLNIQKGQVFKPYDFQQGLQAARDEYGKIGRPFVDIQENIVQDVMMEIDLYINEDQIYRINQVEVTGNNLVKEKTIRKEIIVKDDEIFNLDRIKKTRLHIFELGMFNSVNIIPVNRNPDSLEVDLRIRVSESLPRRWDANVGVRQGRIAELNQTYLFTQVDWLHKNMFQQARRFQIKGNFGIVWDQEQFFRNSSPSYGVDMSYTHPRIFSLRFPTTFKLYYNKDIYSPFTQNIAENDELITTGAEISSLWKLERKLQAIGSFSVRSIESILSEEKTEIQRRFAFQIRFDNRDNFLYPGRGWNMGADFQVVKGISGSPADYYGWNTSASHYVTLFRRLVLATRLEAGHITNRADLAPLVIMYRMGTENTVRGWSQSIGREFLTPDKLAIYADYAKLLGNVEFRLSLPKNFGIEFFLDAGQLEHKLGRLGNPGDLYISAGPGLMYNTFIGPIRLEFPFVVQDPSGKFKTGEQPERHFIIALLFAF